MATGDAANAVVGNGLAHNRQFAFAAQDPEPAWRVRPWDLDQLFCFQFHRVMTLATTEARTRSGPLRLGSLTSPERALPAPPPPEAPTQRAKPALGSLPRTIRGEDRGGRPDNKVPELLRVQNPSTTTPLPGHRVRRHGQLPCRASPEPLAGRRLGRRQPDVRHSPRRAEPTR